MSNHEHTSARSAEAQRRTGAHPSPASCACSRFRSAPLSSQAPAHLSYICLTRTSTQKSQPERCNGMAFTGHVQRVTFLRPITDTTQTCKDLNGQLGSYTCVRQLTIACRWRASSPVTCVVAHRPSALRYPSLFQGCEQSLKPKAPRCVLFKWLVQRSPHPLDLNKTLEAVRTLPTSILDWLGDARLQV